MLDREEVPQTRWVEGSNFADVNFKIDPRTNRVVMMGAMDNLVKGAAGQAIQNMNLMFGLPENTGTEAGSDVPVTESRHYRKQEGKRKGRAYDNPGQ